MTHGFRTTRRGLAGFAAGAGGLLLAGAALGGTVEIDFNGDNFPMPASITNDYLPLSLGTAVFRGIAGDECEFSKQTIGFANADYPSPYTVNGVQVLVVRDQEWATDAVDGECDLDSAELDEDTVDFYAQQNTGDGDGAVWYLGEDTFARPDEGEGPECSDEGAWRAGDDAGAVLAGILMLADPKSGDRYQQEFDEDNAEDMAAVLRKNGKVTIEFGEGATYSKCLVTREWTPLEPGSVEKKWYCMAQGDFPGGLALVEEQKGKTLRVEYIGDTLPPGDFPGDGEDFPAFADLECTDPR